MPDYPPGYDPIQADYTGGSYISPENQAIGGLIGIAAFGMIGFAAFYAYGAAVAAPLTTVTLNFQYQVNGSGPILNGAQTWCTNGTTISQTQQTIVAAINSMGPNGIAPQTAAQMLESWGFTRLLTVEAFLALANYDVTTTPADPRTYGNWGQFLGNWVWGGGTGSWGGEGTPPGFPGFIGGGYPHGMPNGQGGFWACIRIGASENIDCEWHFME